ncbi:MAG: enoyl-CoA hydratase [Microthrixaceae bacterium]
MSQLIVEHHDRVAVLTLDDPGRRNALNVDLCDEMVAALDSLEADDSVGALVVTGQPPAFCAGADLTQLGEAQDEGLRRIYSGFLRLAATTIPSIAAVNGAAVGAGMNLALACDVRLAGRSARFDTRFVDLGLHPGGGHTWMMQRIVGPQTAAATILFGQALGPEDAEKVGLVWRTFGDDELLDRAIAMAARAAAAPRGVARRVKESLATMPSVDRHDEAVELELAPQLWSINQPEFAERLAALKARIH